MPRGWEEALAAVADAFSFTLAELWAMEIEDLLFWLERAKWIAKQRRG